MCYLGDKEQKAMFLVVSRSDAHFGFEGARSDTPVKLHVRKTGHLERNLSTPE